MKNQEVSRQLLKLKTLIKSATASTNDVELLAQWARYFCILAAGILENSLPLIYSEHASRTSSPFVANYVGLQLSKISNPRADRFVEISRSFNEGWSRKLVEFLEEDGRKEAIDGIMSTRNQIAHGKDTGITIARIKDYLEKAEAVLEFIEKQLRP